jgi:hypothetical protein
MRSCFERKSRLLSPSLEKTELQPGSDLGIHGGKYVAYWNKERSPGKDFLMTASVGRKSVMPG